VVKGYNTQHSGSVNRHIKLSLSTHCQVSSQWVVVVVFFFFVVVQIGEFDIKCRVHSKLPSSKVPWPL
jgi:hypothetical protein